MRTLALGLIGVVFVLFLSGSGIANLYTDYLWFDALERSSVWTSVLGTKIALAIVFTSVFFALAWGNLFLADRIAPEFRPLGPEDELVERYQAVAGPHQRRIRVVVAGLFAVFAGANTSGRWRDWMLFRNGGDFGWTDPLFNRDAGFYVFRLPFWTFVVDWTFVALIFVTMLVIVAHYLNGGIRASGKERVTATVKIHLAALLAAVALLRAVAYYLDRFELVNAGRGVYDGALATDVEVQLPALNLLVLISLVSAVLFLATIRRAGWGMPVVAVLLWMVSHLVVGDLFPALYQRLRVEPEESVREASYIGDNIDATRFAYGLDESRLTVVDYAYEASLSTEEVNANVDILDDVATVDPSLMAETFAREQAERQGYAFNSRLDVDRYLVDGDLEPVVLDVRSLNLGGIEAGWEREHVAFTHGYGAVVAAADSDPSVAPDYLLDGYPNLSAVEGFETDLATPQIYFSDGLDGYAIVGASRPEVDYIADGDVPFNYDGTGGVPMGSLIRRVAFALRFQELNPLISGLVTGDSEAIYLRDVSERAQHLAPFLSLDADPYPVLVDGRVQWVIDAYTTTNDFPYSQKFNRSEVLSAGADLTTGFNYVRNSVKVVVDGYDGDVAFYIVDDTDPIVAAWAEAFPGLFSDMDELPADLAEHLRYPADIFRVQTSMWSRYQVSNPEQFLEGALSWKVANEPSGTTDATSELPMPPQYRVTRLPGETETEFVLQRAFVPSSADSATGRPELTGVMIARSDPEHYGQLIQYDLPAGQVAAPDLVDADINKDAEISQFITLRASQGSNVRFGEMQLVMLDDTVIYIRPLYIQSTSGNAVPELTKIIAVSGSRIAMEDTLMQAVRAVTVDGGGGSSTGSTGSTDGDAGGDDLGPVPSIGEATVADLIDLAQEYLDAADELEAAGDAEGAAENRARAQEALEQLDQLLGFSEPVTGNDSGEA